MGRSSGRTMRKGSDRHLLELPELVTAEALAFLEWQSLARAACVCRDFARSCAAATAAAEPSWLHASFCDAAELPRVALPATRWRPQAAVLLYSPKVRSGFAALYAELLRREVLPVDTRVIGASTEGWTTEDGEERTARRGEYWLSISFGSLGREVGMFYAGTCATRKAQRRDDVASVAGLPAELPRGWGYAGAIMLSASPSATVYEHDANSHAVRELQRLMGGAPVLGCAATTASSLRCCGGVGGAVSKSQRAVFLAVATPTEGAGGRRCRIEPMASRAIDPGCVGASWLLGPAARNGEELLGMVAESQMLFPVSHEFISFVVAGDTSQESFDLLKAAIEEDRTEFDPEKDDLTEVHPPGHGNGVLVLSDSERLTREDAAALCRAGYRRVCSRNVAMAPDHSWEMLAEPRRVNFRAGCERALRLPWLGPRARVVAALNFACVGRGAALYDGVESVEATELRAAFPDAAVSGASCNGEIGPQPQLAGGPARRLTDAADEADCALRSYSSCTALILVEDVGPGGGSASSAAAAAAAPCSLRSVR